MTGRTTIGSSHGELTVDADGYVTECRADNDAASGGGHLASITRFDLIEWRRYWGDNPKTSHIDILDVGYWYTDPVTDSNLYAPPDETWRSEVAEILAHRQRRKAARGDKP